MERDLFLDDVTFCGKIFYLDVFGQLSCHPAAFDREYISGLFE